MEKLKAKLRRQGGFTLVELLIVVAIIAILVAVSIPMMNSVLEKSRHAVDQANVRDAVALVSTKYLTEGSDAYGHYAYMVDADYHQGHLGDKKDTAAEATGGVTPECECTGAPTEGLVVSISAPDPAEPDVPVIKTNWTNDGTGATKAVP